MATLQQISDKINSLSGDMTYRKVLEKELDYLAQGRRANHDFVIKTNMRTLRSGPNRGKVRVDGAVIVMYGKPSRHRSTRPMVATALVRQSDRFLATLDNLATALTNAGY